MDYHPSYKTIIENIVLKALHAGHSLDHIQRNVLYFENKAPIWHLKKKGEATADQEKKLFWIDRCLWRHLFPGVQFPFEELVELSPGAEIISGLGNVSTTKVEDHLKTALENKMDVKEKGGRVASATMQQTDGAGDNINKDTLPKPDDAAGKAGKKSETPLLKSWADDAIEEVEAKPEGSTDKPEKSNNRQSGTEPPAQYADTVSAKSKHNTLTKTQAKRQRRRRKDRESQLMDESIWSAPPSSQSQTEAKAPKPDPKAEVQDNTERVPSEVSGEKSGFEKKSGDEENAGVEDKSGNEEINLHKRTQDEIAESHTVPSTTYASVNLPGIPEDIGGPVKTDGNTTIQEKNKQPQVPSKLREFYNGLSDQEKFESIVWIGFSEMGDQNSELLAKVVASKPDLVKGAIQISGTCIEMLERLYNIAGDSTVYQTMVSKLPMSDCKKCFLFVDLESVEAWRLKAQRLLDFPHKENGAMSATGINNNVIAWMSSDLGIKVPRGLVANEHPTSSKYPQSPPGKPISPRLATKRREDLESPASECSRPFCNDTGATTPQVITPPAIEDPKTKGIVTSGLQYSGPLLLDLSLPIEELRRQVQMSQKHGAGDNRLAKVRSGTKIENDGKKPELVNYATNGTKGNTSVKEEPKGKKQTWSRSTFIFSTIGEN
ncbi:hypothetical protein ACEPPN_017305 [Leptodophora sp. 'Broadleaf-Isolate-01']